MYGVKPNYRSITNLQNKFNKNNFAEVVKVTFNKSEISFEKILQHYFESHDPTQLNRQGNDIGTQYRSVILYNNDSQKETIERVLKDYQALLTKAGYGEIQTSIKLLD